jgi:hypothetical protein
MKTLKQIMMSLLGGILFLTTCGQASPVTRTAPVPVVDRATSTSSPIPTNTSVPTETPTATITPLPTIPTFTPTFDVSTSITVMPAPKAECPRENPNFMPTFPIRTDQNFFIENSIESLQYLNAGGELIRATERLSLAFHGNPPIPEDVTGDNTPELVFVDYAEEPKLHIFLCDSGQYRDILPDISDNLTGYSTAIQATVNDLNRNGISDILLRTSCSRDLFCTSLFILEWERIR